MRHTSILLVLSVPFLALASERASATPATTLVMGVPTSQASVRLGTIGKTLYFTAGTNLYSSDGVSASLVGKLSLDAKYNIIASAIPATNGFVVLATSSGGTGVENWDPAMNVVFVSPTGKVETPQISFHAVTLQLGARAFICSSSGLYETDGTNAGTKLVSSLAVAAGDSASTVVPINTTATSAVLARHSYSATYGRMVEYYVTDGTTVGTRLLSPKPVMNSTDQYRLDSARIGNFLYFVPFYPNNGAIVKIDLSLSSWIETKVVSGEFLRFGTSTDSRFLFRSGLPTSTTFTSDGTTSATFPFDAQYEMRGGSKAIFFALPSANAQARSVYVSDLTLAGTTLVFAGGQTDVKHDPGAGVAGWAGKRAYFYADDGVHGAEIARTDGTEAGTESLGDLAPGKGTTSALWMDTLDSSVILAAAHTNEKGSKSYAMYAVSEPMLATADGGTSDAGGGNDAGTVDAGTAQADASSPHAKNASADAATNPGTSGGCSTQADAPASGGALAMLVAFVALLRRWRVLPRSNVRGLL